jgi:trk system potassium uptake protein TrkH
MAIFTAIMEIIGSVLFYLFFSGEMSQGKAIWTSVFQAVSAFNNAGFDLFGSFKSMANYHYAPPVVLLTAALIILGGISFMVISDSFRKRSWSKLTLDSKLVLSTTLVMLVFGMIVVLATESGNSATLGTMSVPYKFLNAFFQSVTARTAGFSTMNISNSADYTLFFTMLLMFVGGASGSTAGGIKVNTFGMIISTIWSTVTGKEHARAFGREFTSQQIHRALAVIIISLALISIVVFLLTVTEEFRFLNLLFETVSAFGTVGLSTGITSGLTVAGRLIITATMFAGRLGPLTLILALIQRQQHTVYRYPEEFIRIG